MYNKFIFDREQRSKVLKEALLLLLLLFFFLARKFQHNGILQNQSFYVFLIDDILIVFHFACPLLIKILFTCTKYGIISENKILWKSISKWILARNLERKILVNFDLTKMHMNVEKWCKIWL